MTKERIRILVDTSRDTGWSDGLIRIEPDNIYQTTNNLDYLSEAVLKNYDVLTICSNTLLKYTDAELRLIQEFVENGGGLLLASSTSRFERDVRKSVSELGVNHVAALFGTRFLPLPEGRGELDTDANPLRGYTKKNLRLTDHEVVDGLGIDDLGLTHCGILDIPADGNVFLEHSETGEPVGTCLHFGSGRILLINTQLFQTEKHPVSQKFIDWLGINRVSFATGNQAIPDEIPIEEQVKQDGKIKIFYTHFVEDLVDTCMAYAKKLAKEMLAKFPEGEKIEWEIDLTPSCVHEYDVGWTNASVMTIGACVSPARLAYSLGVEASELLAHKTLFGKVTELIFDGEGLPFFFGIWAMELLGFETEAAEMLAEAEQQFRENAQAEEPIDIARVYEQRYRKPIWILKALLEKYGDDLFVRLAEVLSEKPSDTEKNMPDTTFSSVDRLIYYLSRAIGEDLFPWFEEIGTTVHPLPLLLNDSDEFVTEVRKYLNGMIRGTTADTSDRIDALDSLLEIADESEHTISALVAKLDALDRYERLTAAAKLINSCDERAVKVLEELMIETGDDGLVAMSVLMLVRNGRGGEMVDRLVEIAPHQDYRYQLETGYLLEKIGYPAAERFSQDGITDKNGAPLLTMDIKRNKGNKDLYLYPIVEGYRVATCESTFHTHHFPHNTHVSGTYVSWVHTKPKYRRRGLSRWAFGASMAHELVHRYSCISLHTRTDNRAHGMYRSFGFVDGLVGQELTKTLRHEQTKIVEGLVVRPYSQGDEVAMASVGNAFYADQVERRARRAERRRTSETWLIYAAERDGELLGYVQARCDESEENVSITEFCLRPQSSEGSTHSEGFLEEIGAALLCVLHNELVKHKYKQISWIPEEEMEKNYVRKLFYNFGYTPADENWVWMFKIVNLPMLLRELSPLLSKRLNESDDYKGWQGTIGIKGSEHRASLTIKDGKIHVSEEVSDGVGICLSTDDDTITRFILGIVTPYAAYLQNQLHIAPTVNSSVIGLLGTLFPKR